MIVLLELLTALLEYIDLILQLSFFQQEFILLYKYLTYYAGIMLNAFTYLLCSKLCQHNRRVPTDWLTRGITSSQLKSSMLWNHRPQWMPSHISWPTWKYSFTIECIGHHFHRISNIKYFIVRSRRYTM